MTLGDGAPCAAIVEPGLFGGGYGPPVAHDFDVPEHAPGSVYCPDLGAVVDLGGDGVGELVLAWFNGNIGVPFEGDIIVLREYKQVAAHLAMSMPSAVRTVDLNADGLLDVYEDQGNDEPFVSFLNTPEGELVRGPLQSPCSLAENYLGDADEDGRADLFIRHAYCGDEEPHTGVKVILDDGKRVQVFDDVTHPGSEDWSVGAPVDHNGDGHLDVVAHATWGGPIAQVFLGDGHGGFSPK